MDEPFESACTLTSASQLGPHLQYNMFWATFYMQAIAAARTQQKQLKGKVCLSSNVSSTVPHGADVKAVGA